MMIDINLQKKDAYQWYAISQGWFCGKGFVDGKTLDKTLIESELSACKSKEDIIKVVKKINGFFALIWTIEASTFVVVDYARSYPFFWKSDGQKIFLSDHLDKYTADPSIWMQNKGLAHSVFIPGHATLLVAWNQLQAGELLEIKDNLCYLHRWFDHDRNDNSSTNHTKDEWAKRFEQIITEQTNRLIQWANGRTIVIPLSGGYDSRFILAGLIKAGYTNIKAFTYGLEGSKEVRLARKIAQQLSIDWVFVPYSNQLLDRFFSDTWKQYIDYASNMSSLPQDQDFFALLHLKEKGWLHKDDIICPGYCGDVQAGSYLAKRYFSLPWRQNNQSLRSYIYHKFVTHSHPKLEELWSYHLPKPTSDDEPEKQISNTLESWVLHEYMTKYILNGVRCYEFFGFNWYLPLWDKAFIHLWQEVPNTLRHDMSLYRSTLENFLFKPLGIYYPEDQLMPNKNSLKDMISSKWKIRLKGLRPTLNKSTKPIDVNGFDYLTKSIQNQLSGQSSVEENISHNSMVGHWLIEYFTKKA